MDHIDSSSINNHQPQPLPQYHPQEGGMMMTPQPQQQTRPFGFGQNFPNSNAFLMGVPNSGNPNFSLAPLTGVSHPFDSGLYAHHNQPQHQQQQQPQTQPQRNGSPAPEVNALATCPVTDTPGSEQTKTKRGRPRKYSPAREDITLGLASNSQALVEAGGADCENEIREGNVVEGSTKKKKRGRPLGSRNRKSKSFGAAAGGTGVAFYMVVVPEGEDIVSKLVELCQGPRTIFVSSACGSVRNVTLRHVAGRTLYHEGQFDIAALSGSSCFENSDGSQNSTLNLTIILAGPDGLFGGGVTRELIAASSIQMIAGSFISEKNQSNKSPISITSPLPTPAPQMSSFSGSARLNNNSTQHDATNESPYNNGSNGHHDGNPQNQNPGFYNYNQSWSDETSGET